MFFLDILRRMRETRRGKTPKKGGRKLIEQKVEKKERKEYRKKET